MVYDEGGRPRDAQRRRARGAAPRSSCSRDDDVLELAR